MDCMWGFDEDLSPYLLEDTDFCFQLNMKYEKVRFVIDNDVKLIHKNEKKNYIRNGNNNYRNNQLYFCKKWNLNINEVRAQ